MLGENVFFEKFNLVFRFVNDGLNEVYNDLNKSTYDPQSSQKTPTQFLHFSNMKIHLKSHVLMLDLDARREASSILLPLKIFEELDLVYLVGHEVDFRFRLCMLPLATSCPMFSSF